MNDTDTMTDDELMREQGMTDGQKRVSRFTFRPVTATTISFLQRNRILEDGVCDLIQQSAAYAFIHSADWQDVRGVVNNRDRFIYAVDDWLEENINHHSELEPITEQFLQAMKMYEAATTTARNPSAPEGPGAKN